MGVYGYEVSTKQGITREQTAERALLSQRGYLEMNEAGGFSDEIPSLAIEDKRKNLLTLSDMGLPALSCLRIRMHDDSWNWRP